MGLPIQLTGGGQLPSGAQPSRGRWGGKRGCSKGPGHCPHPNGAWAAGGVAKEAPGLRAGGWGGVVRVPHHLDAPLTCGVTHVALGHPLTPAPGHARRLPLLIGC